MAGRREDLRGDAADGKRRALGQVLDQGHGALSRQVLAPPGIHRREGDPRVGGGDVDGQPGIGLQQTRHAADVVEVTVREGDEGGLQSLLAAERGDVLCVGAGIDDPAGNGLGRRRHARLPQDNTVGRERPHGNDSFLHLISPPP